MSDETLRIGLAAVPNVPAIDERLGWIDRMLAEAAAPLAERTRSSLAPDWLITSAIASVSDTPLPSEKTDGGREVAGTPSSRMNS